MKTVEQRYIEYFRRCCDKEAHLSKHGIVVTRCQHFRRGANDGNV